MSMHDWERVICVNYEFGISFIWIILERLNICICGDESWHEQQWTWWLIIQWHGFGMRRNTLLMVGNNELVLIQHMINEGWLQMLVGDSYAWYVYPLLGCLYMFSMWSVRNSLKPLGGTLGSCFSGRDVIPWPLLVGVHGGAPSI